MDSIAFAIRHPDDLKPDDVPSSADLRLFSAGGGSELLEWDIPRSSVRVCLGYSCNSLKVFTTGQRTIGSQGGSIWCMAANPASSILALGCEDGTVRLLSLSNDTLAHLRRFDRAKCRLLSIAWGPPAPRVRTNQISNPEDDSSDEDDEDDWIDTWLVTGGSDSSIRRWEVPTGRVIDRMGTDRIRGERTLVWTVGVIGLVLPSC